MNIVRWIGVMTFLVGPLLGCSARAGWLNATACKPVPCGLHGQLIDFTHNHGRDNRIVAPSLCQKRDLYVYLPPCYDPQKQYPLIYWMHGYGQDEQSFADDLLRPIDNAIANGHLPPVIIAAVDGSLEGEPSRFSPGSFFVNSNAGRFEDYLMGDLWDFMHKNFPIRPEPEAHVLAGASMGGGAAFNQGIKHRDRVKVVVGIFPPVNTRWLNCRCDYMANFHPNCWGWRTDFSDHYEVVGSFYGGLYKVRLKQLIDPLYGRGRDVAARVSAENPIENLERYGVKPGELEMYVAYGGQDEFNLDAQVESFVYRSRQLGLDVAVVKDPCGKHDRETALKLLPATLDWLRPRLAPYAPQ